jgi:myosin heavy subunit
MEEVKNNVSAMMKWVYDKTFAWLVQKINLSYSQNNIKPNVYDDKFIGILDIFGFEILMTNSFEQLCINFANERLQKVNLFYISLNSFLHKHFSFNLF